MIVDGVLKIFDLHKDRAELDQALPYFQEMAKNFEELHAIQPQSEAERGFVAKQLADFKAFLAGEKASSAEAARLGFNTYRKGDYKGAVSLFEKAFTDPRVRDDLRTGNLYQAARSAAMADQESQDEAERKRYIDLALGWLSRDLSFAHRALEQVEADLERGPPEGMKRNLLRAQRSIKGPLEFAREKDADLRSIRGEARFKELFEEF